MPIIKSAKKKLRQDKVRTERNQSTRKAYKDSMRGLRSAETGKNTAKKVNEAYSTIDKAAKKGIIHKNKAARLKSKAAKLSVKTT